MFWTLAVLYLVPVWSFRYLPTQDGPAHLDNAQIMKEYGQSPLGSETFYELRTGVVPNLTSHLLLAALLYLVPPLVAEKLLVSLYILGYAGSYRYFLGAFGPSCRPLSWAGLLLVYNRLFWMGFYNYCLSFILVWIILGLCLRWRACLALPHACLLMLLFVCALFTHLVGFLLAFAGALASAIFTSPRHVRSVALIVLAGLPAIGLAMDYFEQTRFLEAPGATALLRDPVARLFGTETPVNVRQEIAGLNVELFAHHVRTYWPFSLVLPAYLVVLGVGSATASRVAGLCPGSLFPAVCGLVLLCAYALVPNHLGAEHGGYLKMRLAPLPFLILVACFRESALPVLRFLVRGITTALLVINLAFVWHTIHVGNNELAEYTAGMDAMNSGHRFFVIQIDPWPKPIVNPLANAAHYYGLGTGNLCLDNYEACTPHFPVKYRQGVRRGRGDWAGYSHRDAVDTVLCWGLDCDEASRGLAGWLEIVSRQDLRIYQRPTAAQTKVSD